MGVNGESVAGASTSIIAPKPDPLTLSLQPPHGSGTHIVTGQEHLSLAEVVRAVVETTGGNAPSGKGTGRWVGGIGAVILSLVGSVYAYSSSLVTHETLQGRLAPLEAQVGLTQEKLTPIEVQLDEVASGVSDLLARADRQDHISAARKLVAKHRREYEAALDQWAEVTTERRPLSKPQKSPALITAEAKLETLLDN